MASIDSRSNPVRAYLTDRQMEALKKLQASQQMSQSAALAFIFDVGMFGMAATLSKSDEKDWPEVGHFSRAAA